MFMKEKKILFEITKIRTLIIVVLTAFVAMMVPVSAMARVNVNIGVALPPPIVAGPPSLVVLPGAPGVYVAPDLGVDLYLWNGWWWRPWEGHWYRSRHYNRGWNYYGRGVPGFYRHVDPAWRGYYRSRRWNGRPWNYRRVPYREFQRRHHR
jgi:hypothetical protein